MAVATHRAARPSDNAPAAVRRWNALQARLEAVEAIPAAEVTDTTIARAGRLAEQLMAMPAPNAAAVRWKLDYLLASDGKETTPAWASSFTAQAVADYRRVLGEL